MSQKMGNYWYKHNPNSSNRITNGFRERSLLQGGARFPIARNPSKTSMMMAAVWTSPKIEFTFISRENYRMNWVLNILYPGLWNLCRFISKRQGHSLALGRINSSTCTLRWSPRLLFPKSPPHCRLKSVVQIHLAEVSHGIEPSRCSLLDCWLLQRQEDLDQDSLSPPAYEILIL